MRMPRVVVCLAAVLSACAMACAQPAKEQTFHFEGGPGPWRLAGGGDLQVVQGKGGRAGNAASVPVHFPGDAEIVFDRKMSWSGFDRLSVDVFVPKGGPRDVQVLAYVVDNDHHWYQALRRSPLAPGQWTTVVFDISDDSDQWQFEGHFQPWDGYVKRALRQGGIKLLSKRPYQGALAVDDIRLYRTKTQRVVPPLQLLNFRTNAESVGCYHKFELTFNLSRSYENPFDPDQIDIRGHFIAPSGKITTVPGFFYRSYIRTMKAKGEDLWEVLTPFGRSEWKVRFTPTETGTYRYYVEVEDGDNLKTGIRSFEVTPSKCPGFVRIGQSDPQYFEFANGDFFYPIGHNITATFDERNAANLGIDLLFHRGTLAYDRYLKGMSENRETLARIWMSSWNLAIEWSSKYDPHYPGLGRYSMQNSWRLDYILEQAEEKGIYVALTLEPHGHWITTIKEESDWRFNPYNVENGGFLQLPQQLFVDPRAMQYYKRRLRYILARWGYSTAIFSWEIFNEIDLGTDYYKKMMPQVIAWEKAIAQYIRAHDQGKHVLTSNRYWYHQGAYLYRQPEIEYTSAHIFGENPIAQCKKACALMKGFGKIFVITELAEDIYGGSRARTRDFMHAALWSSYMLPMATHGWPWWWDFIDEENLYFHFKALARFNEGEDRRGQNLVCASVPVAAENGSPAPRLGAECLFNDRRLYAWIYDRKLIGEKNIEKVPWPGKAFLDLPALPRTKDRGETKLRDGAYDVEFWDTYKGEIVGKAELRVRNGAARLALPKFEKDMALKIYPTRKKTQSP